MEETPRTLIRQLTREGAAAGDDAPSSAAPGPAPGPASAPPAAEQSPNADDLADGLVETAARPAAEPRETPRTIIRGLTAAMAAAEGQQEEAGVPPEAERQQPSVVEGRGVEQDIEAKASEDAGEAAVKGTPRTLIKSFLDAAPRQVRARQSLAPVGRAAKEEEDNNDDDDDDDEEAPTIVIGNAQDVGKEFYAASASAKDEAKEAEAKEATAGQGAVQPKGGDDDADDDGVRSRARGDSDNEAESEQGDVFPTAGDDSDGDGDPFAELEANARQYQRSQRSQDEIGLVRVRASSAASVGGLTPTSLLSATPALARGSRRGLGTPTAFTPGIVSLSGSTPGIRTPGSRRAAVATPGSIASAATAATRARIPAGLQRAPWSDARSVSKTPSVLPRMTLLQGSQLKRRAPQSWEQSKRRKKVPMVPLFAGPGSTPSEPRPAPAQLRATRASKKQDIIGGEVGGGAAKPAVSGPQLPPSLVNRLWGNLLKTSSMGVTNSTKEACAAVQRVSQRFFRQVADDLGAFADHAGRGTIELSDVGVLAFRQRLARDRAELCATVRKTLPREYADEVIAKLPR